MHSHRLLCSLVTAFGVLAFSGEVAATASLGGVVSTSFSEGSGLCNKNKLVPGSTLQDTFALNLVATCGASVASGDLHAEAATGSIGLRVSAGGASSVAAQVSYFDDWLLNVAPGTLAGTYTIPFTFKVEGSVSPGSVRRFPSFFDYAISARDLYAGLGPKTLFSVNESVTAPGLYVRTFSGSVDFRYFGPGSALPMTAEVTLLMGVPQLESGTIDFFNTASVAMTLQPGWSATTSSGLPLALAAVPEPATAAMLVLGLGLLLAARGR